MVPEILYLFIALLACGAVWYIAKTRTEKACSDDVKAATERAAEFEKRASAAEALQSEVREQLRKKEEELSTVRSELSGEKDERIKAETRLQGTEKNLDEQKALIETMKKELSDTFGALSSAALKSSSEDFLRLASEHLGKILSDTKGKLGEHREALDGLLKPLSEALRKYEEQIHTIEVKRKQDYSSLDEQIKGLAVTHRELRKETGNLVSALRKPHVRGRWGEITLRNVVELAGMSAHCDFTEQVSVSSEGGLLRPDMVVHLPGGRKIVIDSKVSMEALLDAFAAKTEEEKGTALKRHVSHVKDQIQRLGSKNYWGQFDRSPELAVLFMGDAALAAALENEPTLMEDSMQKKVLIVTPTTLFALLSAVAYGWRQEQATKNSEAIAALGKELYERVAVWAGHLSSIGRELGQAVDTYNKAVGSMESRVMPSVRKFKELGATGAEDIPQLAQTDKTTRNLNLIE
jgi:DNA recombination protein RmuC